MQTLIADGGHCQKVTFSAEQQNFIHRFCDDIILNAQNRTNQLDFQPSHRQEQETLNTQTFTKVKSQKLTDSNRQTVGKYRNLDNVSDDVSYENSIQEKQRRASTITLISNDKGSLFSSSLSNTSVVPKYNSSESHLSEPLLNSNEVKCPLEEMRDLNESSRIAKYDSDSINSVSTQKSKSEDSHHYRECDHNNKIFQGNQDDNFTNYDDENTSNSTESPSTIAGFLADDHLSLKPSILKNPLRSNSGPVNLVRTVFDIAGDDLSERRSVTIGENDIEIILEFPEENFDNTSLENDEDEPPPPNGGWGWVIAFSAFIVNVVIIGQHNSFAWIGSIAFGCILIFAPIGGVLSNRYGCRSVTIAGVIISALSILISSFASSVETMFFTYGFGFGIGTSLSYMQGMIMVSRYFSTRRALASGIVLSGSSIGTLVMAPVYATLSNYLEWRITLRILSGITFSTAIAGWMYRPLKKNCQSTVVPTVEQQVKTSIAKRFILDMSLWKNKAFVVWAVSVGLCKLGYLLPFVHLVTYTQDLGLDESISTILMSLLGITSGISRLVSGFIADSPKINRLYLSQASAFFMGLITVVTPSFASMAGVFTYVIILGILDGGMEILLPVMTHDLVGADHMSIAWGCLLAVISASASGPPIAGAIRDATGSYAGAFYFSGTPMLLSTFVLALIPLWAQKQKQKPTTSFLSVDPSRINIAMESVTSFGRQSAPISTQPITQNRMSRFYKGAKNGMRGKLTVIWRKNPFRKNTDLNKQLQENSTAVGISPLTVQERPNI